MNIADLIRRQASRTPAATAIVTDIRTLDFATLEDLVTRCVALLSVDAGFTAICTVGLSFRSQLAHLVASLALWHLGKAQITLPLRTSAFARIDLAKRAGVQAILTDELAADDIDLPRWVIELDKLCQQPHVVSPDQPFVRPDAPSLYVVGSGTTGTSKLIWYTQDQLLASIDRDLRARPIAPGERHLSLTPIDYFTAKRRTIGCLAAGGTAFLNEQTDMVRLCDIAAVEHLSMVVIQAEQVLDHFGPKGCATKLSRLKSLVIGSAPVSEKLRARLSAILSHNILVTYGSNEFGEATVATPEIQAAYPGSVGRPVPGVEVNVVDDQDAPLPAGARGFIRLRGNGVFSGYVEDSLATAKVLRNGWYYPGDLGSITDDGVLIFHGRADDLMIFDGINIYPREIELVLEQHPAVVEAAAFPLRSVRHTHLPAAAVRLRTPVDEQTLRTFCLERLGSKAPLRIAVLDDFPRNAAGKVLKRQLPSLLA